MAYTASPTTTELTTEEKIISATSSDVTRLPYTTDPSHVTGSQELASKPVNSTTSFTLHATLKQQTTPISLNESESSSIGAVGGAITSIAILAIIVVASVLTVYLLKR